MQGGQTTSCVIAINAGSSSLKATLYKTTDIPEDFEILDSLTIATSKAADYSVFIEQIRQTVGDRSIAAIGHRLVHGGPKYSQTTRITDIVQNDLNSLAPYDPDHLPTALKLIELSGKTFVGTPQFACFDTAFFSDLPRLAQLLPLPKKYQSDGLRRYGFHGLSYTYLQSAFREEAGETAVNGRVIYAHLGSGASLAATNMGKPVDTTMSFTPASGLVMSSRSGDLDPGIGWYLYRRYNISPEQYNDMVNTQSGLLGVSDFSADMKTLLEHEIANQQAAEAVELFCYRTAQAISGLTATIGGLDSLVFSGGIGEQSAILRQRICSRLTFLGISLDETRNQTHQKLISKEQSNIGVHVLPTDEGHSIVTQVLGALHEKGDHNG